MKVMEHRVNRRSILKGGAIAGLAWLGRPFVRGAQAQQQIADISAVAVDRIPTEPDDPEWALEGRVRLSELPLPVALHHRWWAARSCRELSRVLAGTAARLREWPRWDAVRPRLPGRAGPRQGRQAPPLLSSEE